MTRAVTGWAGVARAVVTLLGLLLFVCHVAQAQATHKIQRVVKLGDPLGEIFVDRAGGFRIGALNDQGHLLLVADHEAGGQVLVQFAGGKLTPIVVREGDAPGGKWPKTVRVLMPVSINPSGNAVFAADVTIGGKTALGTFLWNDQTQQVSPVALAGMPAVNNQVFEQAGGIAPALSARGEVALVAQIKNAAGKAQDAVFFLGQDGKLLPIALPDQPLPGGRKVLAAFAPSINDAGAISFLARRQGDAAESAYLWDQGTITPVAEAGADAPGGGKLAAVLGVWVNNKDRGVLVLARLRNSGDVLYLLADGKLQPVAVPGQDMPGGGKLRTVQELGVSAANGAGQHAFLAVLQDKATAAYLIDAGGRLSLILKQDATTELGKVANVGQGAGSSRGIALNTQGQVAVTLRLGSGRGGGSGGGGDGDHGGGGGGGGDFVVLLTPQ
jgi:hypothetical protein